MKHHRLSLAVLSVCLLAGCTPFLADLNANLKQVNAGLKQANAGLRGAPGSSSAASTGVDATVCDSTAFNAGFKDQYVANWNKEVGSREAHYQFISQQRPENTAARHNYALYRGKRLPVEGKGHQLEYRLRWDSQGRILNDCQANSYMQGETAGMRKAGQDLKALADQEFEISSL